MAVRVPRIVTLLCLGILFVGTHAEATPRPIKQAMRVLNGAHRSAYQPWFGPRPAKGDTARSASRSQLATRYSVATWNSMVALPGAGLHQQVRRMPLSAYKGSLQPKLEVVAPYPVGTVLKVGNLGEVTVTEMTIPGDILPGRQSPLEMKLMLTTHKASRWQLRTTQRTLFVPMSLVRPPAPAAPAGDATSPLRRVALPATATSPLER
jgi:hypothetical protein